MIAVGKLQLIFLITMLMVGCASVKLEPYRVPGSISSYVTIKDRPFRIGMSEYEKIVSIDRKRVDSKSRGVPEDVGLDHNDLKNVIVLAVGVRKLHIEACKFYFNVINIFFGSPWRCANSVIRLEASPGFQYRVRAILNKKDDYADFWIESIESGDKVIEPIRVLGLGSFRKFN